MSATEIPAAGELSPLIAGIRTAVERRAGWAETAQLVTDQVRRHAPTPGVLTADQRLGSPDDYRAHTLYVEPDGSFSIVALVWRPGQITRIHDHVAWCVLGVIQGAAWARAPGATTTDLERRTTDHRGATDEQAQVSHLDLGRRIRGRPEPERGEPARRGR